MNIALKEWAVVVSAMKQGSHQILLRKGGLADKGQEFSMEHNRFLLFPTYEHQQADMIADEHQKLFRETLNQKPSPEQLIIDSWAEFKESFVVKNLQDLLSISDRHIWSQKYLRMRLDYKPEKPLYVIRLKVNALNTVCTLVNLKRYGGCRSWVQLDQDVAVNDSR